MINREGMFIQINAVCISIEKLKSEACSEHCCTDMLKSDAIIHLYCVKLDTVSFVKFFVI